MLTLEEIEELDFEKMNGLIPAIIQHADTGKVLMLGFMNKEALQQTIETQNVVFFSRSKNRLWKKGETSGNVLNVQSIGYDCDKDTVLILAHPQGATCHTGSESCFGDLESPSIAFLPELERVIATRKLGDPNLSYTASLYQSGIKRIAQKVGEEGVEVALAATVKDYEELKNESADLLYHLLVLLNSSALSLKDVIDVLKSRHQ